MDMVECQIKKCDRSKVCPHFGQHEFGYNCSRKCKHMKCAKCRSIKKVGKTIRAKRPAQHRKGEICQCKEGAAWASHLKDHPGLIWNYCPNCGKLSPVAKTVARKTAERQKQKEIENV